MPTYKAIVFDLDGTAIPNTRDGMPSERLIQAVTQAKDNIHLIAATGRPASQALPVIQTLQLHDPSVICGGTIIIDPASGGTIHEAKLNHVQLSAIQETLGGYPYRIGVDDHPPLDNAAELDVTTEANILIVINIESRDLTSVIQKLSDIPGVLATSARSWAAGDLHVIHITPRDGSKEHGVGHVLEKLGLRPEEVIGVGDGDNDIHLFAAVGHRIAMGNASEQLKSIADEIAPSVDEDGLAWVIERYS